MACFHELKLVRFHCAFNAFLEGFVNEKCTQFMQRKHTRLRVLALQVGGVWKRRERGHSYTLPSPAAGYSRYWIRCTFVPTSQGQSNILIRDILPWKTCQCRMVTVGDPCNTRVRKVLLMLLTASWWQFMRENKEERFCSMTPLVLLKLPF